MKQFKETNAIGNKQISFYSCLTESGIARLTRSRAVHRCSCVLETENQEIKFFQSFVLHKCNPLCKK